MLCNCFFPQFFVTGKTLAQKERWIFMAASAALSGLSYVFVPLPTTLWITLFPAFLFGVFSVHWSTGKRYIDYCTIYCDLPHSTPGTCLHKVTKYVKSLLQCTFGNGMCWCYFNHIFGYILNAALNLCKHWILDAWDWIHHNLAIATRMHGYPHCTGSDIIIWISHTRENTSLLPALTFVSHLPCSKSDPSGIWTIHTQNEHHTIHPVRRQCTSRCHYD